MKKYAFTLAETLITLMVIGVVAALTIPALIQSYQDMRYSSGYKKIQSTLKNGFNQMIGEETISGYASTEDFIEAMKKYFKIAQVCGNNELANCFAEKITTEDEEIELSDLTKASNLGKEWSTDTNTNGVVLSDGSSMILAYNKDGCLDHAPKRETIIDSCVAIVFDLDGKSKGGKYIPYDDEKKIAKSDIGLYNASLASPGNCGTLTAIVINTHGGDWDEYGFGYEGPDANTPKCKLTKAVLDAHCANECGSAGGEFTGTISEDGYSAPWACSCNGY